MCTITTSKVMVVIRFITYNVFFALWYNICMKSIVNDEPVYFRNHNPNILSDINRLSNNYSVLLMMLISFVVS